MSLGPASCASVHHGWPAGTGEIPGERLGWGVRHPQGHTQSEAYRIRTCGRPIGTRIEGATDERRRCHPGWCPDGPGAATESWVILYRHHWTLETPRIRCNPRLLRQYGQRACQVRLVTPFLCGSNVGRSRIVRMTEGPEL